MLQALLPVLLTGLCAGRSTLVLPARWPSDLPACASAQSVLTRCLSALDQPIALHACCELLGPFQHCLW